MGVTVVNGGFTNREEALALVEEQNLFARDGAMPGGDLEDVHWHKTSLKIYVLAGSFETKDVETGQLLTAIAGNLISIPSKALHAARCPLPAKYVVGFESEDAARSFRPEDPSDL
ncbi:MAG: hypothetical protein ACI9ON_002725 [Limisphaerales bacterium]